MSDGKLRLNKIFKTVKNFPAFLLSSQWKGGPPVTDTKLSFKQENSKKCPLLLRKEGLHVNMLASYAEPLDSSKHFTILSSWQPDRKDESKTNRQSEQRLQAASVRRTLTNKQIDQTTKGNHQQHEGG